MINIALSPVMNTGYNDRELKFDMPVFLRDKVRPFGPDVGYAAFLFYFWYLRDDGKPCVSPVKK